MKPVLAFDIETIPGRRGLAPPACAWTRRFPTTRWRNLPFSSAALPAVNDFLPLHLQRVAVISCALRVGKDFRVWSLAEPEQGEGEIIQRFFDGIDKFTPQIVSWNGGGFDLPVSALSRPDARGGRAALLGPR
jgi:hypothetical protein